MRKLIIIRGVSGSGKTTFAEMLVKAFRAQDLLAVNYEADDFFYDEEGTYNFVPSLLAEAHDWCKNCVEVAMQGDVNVVIVSNTATSNWEFEGYIKLAEKYGYTIDCLVKENRHEGVSVHDVPHAVLERQKIRLERSLKL